MAIKVQQMSLCYIHMELYLFRDILSSQIVASVVLVEKQRILIVCLSAYLCKRARRLLSVLIYLFVYLPDRCHSAMTSYWTWLRMGLNCCLMPQIRDSRWTLLTSWGFKPCCRTSDMCTKRTWLFVFLKGLLNRSLHEAKVWIWQAHCR